MTIIKKLLNDEDLSVLEINDLQFNLRAKTDSIEEYWNKVITKKRKYI